MRLERWMHRLKYIKDLVLWRNQHINEQLHSQLYSSKVSQEVVQTLIFCMYTKDPLAKKMLWGDYVLTFILLVFLT